MTKVNVDQFSPVMAVLFPLITISYSDGYITDDEKNDITATVTTLYGEGGVFPKVTHEEALSDIQKTFSLFYEIDDYKTQLRISIECCKNLNLKMTHDEAKRAIAQFLVDAAKADGEIDEIEDQVLTMLISVLLDGVE